MQDEGIVLFQVFNLIHPPNVMLHKHAFDMYGMKFIILWAFC